MQAVQRGAPSERKEHQTGSHETGVLEGDREEGTFLKK